MTKFCVVEVFRANVLKPEKTYLISINGKKGQNNTQLSFLVKRETFRLGTLPSRTTSLFSSRWRACPVLKKPSK